MIKEVGIIVGRFQVPELHAGHKFLIESVENKYNSTFIFLGSPKDPGLTEHDPLPYRARKNMILSFIEDELGIVYGFDTVYEIVDRGDWALWVKDLDEKIESLQKLGLIPQDAQISICGSRDSVVSKYKESGGKFFTDYIDKKGNFSGTQARDNFNYYPSWTDSDRKLALWMIKNMKK